MVAFAGQADVLKVADTSGAVAIVEVTTDWSAGSSVISCSSWFQVVTKRRTGTIFWEMSGTSTIGARPSFRTLLIQIAKR